MIFEDNLEMICESNHFIWTQSYKFASIFGKYEEVKKTHYIPNMIIRGDWGSKGEFLGFFLFQGLDTASFCWKGALSLQQLLGGN